MSEPRIFTCADCGVEVVSVGFDTAANDNKPDLCGTCAWLRTIENPAEREQIRAVEQSDTILEGKPDARLELLVDVLQPQLRDPFLQVTFSAPRHLGT